MAKTTVKKPAKKSVKKVTPKKRSAKTALAHKKITKKVAPKKTVKTHSPETVVTAHTLVTPIAPQASTVPTPPPAPKAPAPPVKPVITEVDRPPVVVILGQVDHGKTSLLDYIRKTSLTAKEAGGITQDIGAYEARVNNETLIFIDTPGHQAFSKLRAFGTKVADVGILIIDTTEGVREQTIESLKILQEAKIPFAIALNKIDKPGADPQKIKNELLRHGIQTEDMGGDIPAIAISAVKGTGVSELLEILILLGQIKSLKARADLPGEAFVVSSRESPTKGIETDIILKNGVLKVGDSVISDTSFGRVKRIENTFGQSLVSLNTPAPLRIYGLERTPDIGEKLNVVNDPTFFEQFKVELGEKLRKLRSAIVFGNPDGKYHLNIILKVPSFALKDAVINLLKKITLKNTALKINKIDVGDINLDDVNFAHTTRSLILGFKVKFNKNAGAKATLMKVSVKTYEVIYDMEKDIVDLIKANVTKETIRDYFGTIQVLKIFREEKDYKIIGGKVINALPVAKGNSFEISRRGFVVGTGKITELEQNKVKVTKIENNQEFGMMVSSGKSISVSEELKVYEDRVIEPEL